MTQSKGMVKYAVLVGGGPFGKEGKVEESWLGEDWLSLVMWKQSSVFGGSSRLRRKHKALHETVCTVDTSALDFRSNGSTFISPFEIPSVSSAIEVLALVQSLWSQPSDPSSLLSHKVPNSSR